MKRIIRAWCRSFKKWNSIFEAKKPIQSNTITLTQDILI